MHQQEQPDKQQGKPGKQRSLGWSGIRHGWSAVRTLPLACVWILGWRGGSWRRGRNWAGDVTVGGSQVACETDHSDHDENHRKGIAKSKISAAELVEKKQNADGDDHR